MPFVLWLSQLVERPDHQDLLFGLSKHVIKTLWFKQPIQGTMHGRGELALEASKGLDSAGQTLRRNATPLFCSW